MWEIRNTRPLYKSDFLLLKFLYFFACYQKLSDSPAVEHFICSTITNGHTLRYHGCGGLVRESIRSVNSAAA